MGAGDDMTTPAITYTGPAVESSVPFEIRRHLQLIYQKLGNHTQAFALQQAKINAIKSGTSTTIEEGGSGGGFVIPATSAILAVNNQSGVTSYATVSGDDGALITLSDASPIAVSLTPQQPPWGCFFVNLGAATATLTPAAIGTATPTITYPGNIGAASMPIASGGSATVAFDGTNWWAELTASASSGYSLGGTLTSANFVLGPGAGTGASITSVVGMDGNHSIQIATGTSPTASAVIYTCTFTASRGHTTYPVGVPSGGIPITGTSQIPFFSFLGATSYELFANTTALTAGSSYSWNVSCP